MKLWLKACYLFSGLFGFYYLSPFLFFLRLIILATILFIVYLLFGLGILKSNKFSDLSLLLNGVLLTLVLIFKFLLVGKEGESLILAGLMFL